jgi:hypothetical protein
MQALVDVITKKAISDIVKVQAVVRNIIFKQKDTFTQDEYTAAGALAITIIGFMQGETIEFARTRILQYCGNLGISPTPFLEQIQEIEDLRNKIDQEEEAAE